MRVPRLRSVVAPAALLALAACSKTDSAAGEGDTAAAAGAAQAAGGRGGASGESTGKVHLVVTGGPHAGTYDVNMPDAGCSYGLAGQGAWGNQYSLDTADAKAFSSLQLIVPDTKDAADGTRQFLITAGFGPILSMTTYDVDTRPNANEKKGSGTLTVDDRGSTGKVTFNATTAEGVKLEGTIDCSTVMRAG